MEKDILFNKWYWSNQALIGIKEEEEEKQELQLLSDKGTNANKDEENLDHSHIDGRNVKWSSHFGKV